MFAAQSGLESLLKHDDAICVKQCKNKTYHRTRVGMSMYEDLCARTLLKVRYAHTGVFIVVTLNF